MFQLFGIDQPSRGNLDFPAIRRLVPEPARHRIELSEIEVPAVLVRFAAVEHRSLQGPGAMIDRSRHDTEGDVRRVEGVVTERCERIVRCRGTVHEGYRTERRLARRSTGAGQPRLVGQRRTPDRSQLHEQIVGMLPVDERPAADRLAYLKNLAITSLANGGRVEAQHGNEGQLRLSDIT